MKTDYITSSVVKVILHSVEKNFSFVYLCRFKEKFGPNLSTHVNLYLCSKEVQLEDAFE